jgi:hypothetical protein
MPVKLDGRSRAGGHFEPAQTKLLGNRNLRFAFEVVARRATEAIRISCAGLPLKSIRRTLARLSDGFAQVLHELLTKVTSAHRIRRASMMLKCAASQQHSHTIQEGTSNLYPLAHGATAMPRSLTRRPARVI